MLNSPQSVALQLDDLPFPEHEEHELFTLTQPLFAHIANVDLFIGELRQIVLVGERPDNKVARLCIYELQEFTLRAGRAVWVFVDQAGRYFEGSHFASATLYPMAPSVGDFEVSLVTPLQFQTAPQGLRPRFRFKVPKHHRVLHLGAFNDLIS